MTISNLSMYYTKNEWMGGFIYAAASELVYFTSRLKTNPLFALVDDEAYNQLAMDEVNNFKHTDTVHTVVSERDEAPVNSH